MHGGNATDLDRVNVAYGFRLVQKGEKIPHDCAVSNGSNKSDDKSMFLHLTCKISQSDGQTMLFYMTCKTYQSNAMTPFLCSRNAYSEEM